MTIFFELRGLYFYLNPSEDISPKVRFPIEGSFTEGFAYFAFVGAFEYLIKNVNF